MTDIVKVKRASIFNNEISDSSIPFYFYDDVLNLLAYEIITSTIVPKKTLDIPDVHIILKIDFKGTPQQCWSFTMGQTQHSSMIYPIWYNKFTERYHDSHNVISEHVNALRARVFEREPRYNTHYYVDKTLKIVAKLPQSAHEKIQLFHKVSPALSEA
jgi:hypothetical protein